jgi:hypothetical protein
MIEQQKDSNSHEGYHFHLNRADTLQSLLSRTSTKISPPCGVDTVPIVQLITLPHHLVVPPARFSRLPARIYGDGFLAASMAVFVRLFE